MDKARSRIFIPARDEAATVGDVVQRCLASGFNVTVLDDASRDATAARAQAAGAQVVSLPGPHHGKTAALRHALTRLTDGLDWIAFMDGDGQHDPADLERFWNARHGADLVVGNRLPNAIRMPPLRRWTNRAMSSLLRHSGIADSQCGFRLIRRSWLGDWLPEGHHFQFESELALAAATRVARVVNLPIAATYGGEESKIVPWRDAVNFVSCLRRHQAVMSARARHPQAVTAAG